MDKVAVISREKDKQFEDEHYGWWYKCPNCNDSFIICDSVDCPDCGTDFKWVD